VRMFNASSLWVHYSAQSRGTASLIQLVSFASRPGTAVSLRIQYPHREVRMHTLESGAPNLLEPVRVGRDIEYYLPAFSTYSALEVTA